MLLLPTQPRRKLRLARKRMETAFGWLAELRKHDAGMALQLMYWANWMARRRNLRSLCIEKKWAFRSFFRRATKGKEWIAQELKALGTSVF